MPAQDALQLQPLIAARDWAAIESGLERADWSAADLAAILVDAEPGLRTDALLALSPPHAAAIFREFDPALQPEALTAVGDLRAAELLERLEIDDRTRALEQVPPEAVTSLLERLSPRTRRQSEQWLRYPVDSVGRLMTSGFVAVRPDWSIAAALSHIRAHAPGARELGRIYVTADDGRLLDMLELSGFVLASPEARVEDIMDRRYVCLSPEDDREQAVRMMQRHDLAAVPVVEQDVLRGVVTVDDVLDVAEEEATEDIQKQAGVTPLRAAYPHVGIVSLFRKRIPWLAALIFVYLGASEVIAAFEEALAAQLVLAAFIPLLMGSGGNVGAQSGTLVVRALATGDLEGPRWRTVLWKELSVGIALGVALAILAGIVGQIRGGTDVGLVIAVSMFGIVVSANLFGLALPILLARLGIDPAVAGSPVITSITDITSLLIYLGIASQVLGI